MLAHLTGRNTKLRYCHPTLPDSLCQQSWSVTSVFTPPKGNGFVRLLSHSILALLYYRGNPIHPADKSDWLWKMVIKLRIELQLCVPIIATMQSWRIDRFSESPV